MILRHETIVSKLDASISSHDTVVLCRLLFARSGGKSYKHDLMRLKNLCDDNVKPYAMAGYIKREMPDMNGSGEKKCYYKVRTYSNLSSEDFVKKICYPGSGLNQGDVAKVMCRMVDEMKRWLAEGHTVTLDELGTFSLSIGVMDEDEVEDFERNRKKVTAKRIGVRGVNFRPEKQLVKDISRRCKLHKGYESPNNRSPYTREERLKMAQDYIAEHHFMRVRDYEAMTLLPHSTAANELRDFCIQPTGITSERNYNNPEVKVQAETFLRLVIDYNYPPDQ